MTIPFRDIVGEAEMDKALEAANKEYTCYGTSPRYNDIYPDFVSEITYSARLSDEAEKFDELIMDAIKPVAEGFSREYIINKDKVVEAFRKQQPQKPINLKGRWLGEHLSGNCPVCAATVNSASYKYCRKCGQAIDWSDING